MSREEADNWFRGAFGVDVASLRQSAGNDPAGVESGDGGSASGNSTDGGAAATDPSSADLTKQAAAKAKQEADAAAADFKDKNAAIEQKRQAAEAALHDAEAKFQAENEIETAAKSAHEADALKPPQSPSGATNRGEASAADLLDQAAAKAKQEAEAAGARYTEAAHAFEQARADAQAALELAEAKYKAEFDAETAADDANKPPPAAPRPGANPGTAQPIGPDCKPVRDKVDGPKEHVLCGTHGHVYDEKTGLIIADSVAAYDAQHPVPRPIEADCKIVRGKMPGAPQPIVLCATHEHVIDETKGQIVANTARMYYRAHPAPPAPAAPKQIDEAGPANAPAARSPAHLSPDMSVGSLQQSVDGENDIQQVIIGVNLRASGDLEYSLSWNYADPPAGELPASVHEQIALSTDMGDDLGTIAGPAHKVEAGKLYSLRGKRKLKPVDGMVVHVATSITAQGADRPALALSGEFKITLSL